MSNTLTYREKFTAEMTWGGIPMTDKWARLDVEYIRGSKLFQEGLKKFDSGEWKYLEKEIWKDVKGWEGTFQVSNHGRMRSLTRYINRKSRWGGIHLHKIEGRILKQVPLGKGNRIKYLCIGLKREGQKFKNITVHRLVALAFIPLIEGKNYVNHKDGNVLNNHYTNLEWTTNRENLCHAELKNNTSSKYIGVSYKAKGARRWEASISVDKKYIYIGRFYTEIEAANAYKKKLEELGIVNKYIGQ